MIACRNARPNFGDDLNGVLWPALAPELFDQDRSEGFLGIGTIVGMPTPGIGFLHVFSSGVGYDRLDGWKTPRRLWCVRGPLSARALGAEPNLALTDGAVLVPRLLAKEPPATGGGETVVVPHWESLDVPGWPEACALAGLELLSPAHADPLAVCRRLSRARLVLTESLHGAIVADAFGVPWVPLATSGNFSAFKWTDWCASVGVALDPLVVPPPSAEAWVRFGRPRLGDLGRRVRVDADQAWREYEARADAPAQGRSLRSRVKAAALKSGLVRRTLGLSPARTAEALRRAAEAAPCLSDAARRAALAGEMLARLSALRAERAPSRRPAVVGGRATSGAQAG
nr:polysaccharide pyruvyl transferase family protein [Caulobacter sp. 17J80-11]